MPRVSWDQPAKNGTLRFLKFLRSYSIGHLGYFTLQTAAGNGHLEVVKWLYAELGVTLTPDAMKRTAQNGHLDVVEWFHENGCEGCDVDTLINTAGSGHLDVVKWLDKHGVHPTGTAAIACAARSGHLDVVKWLHKHQTDRCFDLLLDDAATNGRLDIVQYLHEELKASSTTIYLDRIGWGSAGRPLGHRAVPPHASLLRLFVSDVEPFDDIEISISRSSVYHIRHALCSRYPMHPRPLNHFDMSAPHISVLHQWPLAQAGLPIMAWYFQ
ncbi:Ankyrin repeat-containing domain [Phytophthora cactorum]|nr:Ankyrin repeat-containing domain [Phytophthora cactorum]